MKEANVNTEASYYNEEYCYKDCMLHFRFCTKVFSCFRQLLGTNVAMKVVDDLIAEKYSYC